MSTIDISTGDLVEITGNTQVLQSFVSALRPPNDLTFESEKIICEDDKICVLGYFKGTSMLTRLGLILLDEPFEVRVTVYVEYLQEKIKRIEYFYDTFKIMQLCGTAFLKHEDKSIIRSYLDNLVSMGLILNENIQSIDER